MYVKPAEGRAVRDPRSRLLLPDEGHEVPETSFWLRRVRDKDVVVAVDPALAVSEQHEEAAALPAPEGHTQAEEH